MDTVPNSTKLVIPPQHRYLIYVGIGVFVVVCLFVIFSAGKLMLSRMKNNGESNMSQNAPANVKRPVYAVSDELLSNTAITQWRAGVEGVVTEKFDDGFTLTADNGKTIRMYFSRKSGEAWNYRFINQSTDTDIMKTVPFDELPLQTRVNGGFWVFDDDNNRPVADVFLIQE